MLRKDIKAINNFVQKYALNILVFVFNIKPLNLNLNNNVYLTLFSRLKKFLILQTASSISEANNCKSYYCRETTNEKKTVLET